MQRNKRFSITVWACGLAVVVAASEVRAQIGDTIPPSMGGLPANTPPRTGNAPPYPNVHDVPPPRPTPALSKTEQQRLERELTAVRARHERLQDPKAKAQAPADRPAKKDAQKKPSRGPSQ